MGNISEMFQSGEDNVKLSRVVSLRKTGIVVRTGNIDSVVRNASNETIKIGDTVLLNRSSNGKFYIVGKTEGLRNQNIEEVYIDG